MSRYFISILLLIFIVSACKTPEARRPIKTSSNSYIDASVEKNKRMIAEDEKEILAIIKRDTINNFHLSEKGFWYYYNTKIYLDSKKAAFGDFVSYEYDLRDLNGSIIYSKQDLGTQTYNMDKEELISGLRDALKILKEGETATFLLPSHKAYGYYGDLKRIGTNMPIISTVTILNIKQIN